jgi:hypothetical protein
MKFISPLLTQNLPKRELMVTLAEPFICKRRHFGSSIYRQTGKTAKFMFAHQKRRCGMAQAGLSPDLVVKATSRPKFFPTNPFFLFLVGVSCLAGMALVGLVTTSGLCYWLIILGLLVLLTGIISLGSTGSWLGILIDDRNEISLSRFQMALWTLLMVSAFLGMVMVNVYNHKNPLEAM